MEAIGLLPRFRGTSVHDGWTPYWHDGGCCHARCNVHLLRELTWIAEQVAQGWASDFKALLLEMRTAVATARTTGADCLESAVRARLVARYGALLAARYGALLVARYGALLVARYGALLVQGVTANPLPPPAPGPRKRGRRKQSPVRHRLDRLFQHQHEGLAFLDDFAVPFDNNQAERDLRMLKMRQKISGCFRSDAGAIAFCRIRGVLSTLAKQGTAALATLQSGFTPSPLPLLPTT
jgi:transposase